MYAPIDPRRGHLQDILRSLGAVLDAHLAREVHIAQQPGGVLVRAQVVATIADRLEGTWSRLERRLTHLDMAQAQMAAAARYIGGLDAGPMERALDALGRMADERDLRGVTIIQHASGGGWLAWHTGPDDQPSLLTFSLDELLPPLAPTIAIDAAGPDRAASRGPEPSRERARAHLGRAMDGRALRPQLGSALREALPVR